MNKILLAVALSIPPYCLADYLPNEQTNVLVQSCYSPITPPAILEIGRALGKDMPRQRPFGCNYGHGSGVVVSADGLILTCAHVVKSPLLRIKFSNGSVRRAYLVGKNDETDTAVLRVFRYDETFAFANIADFEPSVGDTLYSIGHPVFLRNMITKGIVSGYDYEYMLSDTHIDHGSSGGGIYNARRELVGLNKGMIDGIYFVFCRLNNLKAILEKYQ